MPESARALSARVRLRALRRPRLVAAAVGLLVVVAAAGVAVAATGSSGPSYRTGLVTRANVSQTLTEVGTLAPATQAQVAFPVSGVVSKVDVHAGQRVTAGQRLASLRTSTLSATVRQDQAALTQAQATLTGAESPGTGSSGGSGGGSGGGGGRGGSGGVSGSVSGLESAVVAAQRGIDAQSATVRSDTAAAERECGGHVTTPPGRGHRPGPGRGTGSGTAARPEVSTTAAPSVSPRPTPTSTPSPRPTPDPSSHPLPTASESRCLRAEQKLLGAETSLGRAETSLAGAESSLAGALAGSQRSSSGGSDPTSGAALGASLAADQADIDAAGAQLRLARQDLAQADLVSPLTGTVLSVGLAAGQADTSADDVVVEGRATSYDVDTTVPVSDLPSLHTGERTSVVLDGSATPLAATVAAIGAQPGSGTSDYPVTVALHPTSRTLRDGVSATVTIVVASAADALSVPTSAVHTLGTIDTVSVLRGSTLSTVPVTLGARGAERTVVESGVRVGERVVVADLSTPLPTTTTGTFGVGRFAGGGGAFAGGGGGGGGAGAGFRGQVVAP